MSTVSDLQTRMDFYLGHTDAYSDSDKLVGLNEARKHMLMNYEVDEFIIEEDITFTLGIALIPATYLRWVKMFNPTDATTEYRRKNVNDFDRNISNSWTIKADINDTNIRKFFIYPTDIATTRLRYIEFQADMAADTDLTGFNPYWDSAHAAWAAWWVFTSDRQFDSIPGALEVAKELSETAMRQQDTENEFNPDVDAVFDHDVQLFDESQ